MVSSATIFVDPSDALAALAAAEFSVSTASLIGFLQTSVADNLHDRATARFAGEGDDVSEKWAPLRPATQVQRIFGGYGPDHPINERSGALRKFVTAGTLIAKPTGAGASMMFPGIAPNPKIQKKYEGAQKGVKRGENPMFPSGHGTVPRPVAGVNENDLQATLVDLSLHIHTVMSTRAFGMQPAQPIVSIG